ncbi:30S ribosomal protein S17 [Venenivibrio stagnispumantis]|uniref:Small ribosomal subunit protein uS17 n=1 Tax=Venenivibrio stagnispumantis TaxID=407998 RepID=A0AA45WLH8_9AQUI|nr:30S ribosomal protein S17 [Venenivibrio stagnispumantis]MCW4573308.1 30S ribosomal protein S17 [Venenivibrio stagnispumantis]SMP11050.1 SSU ribosomal protein S17P [Venenivibrio stagnispumantis]
MTEQKKHIKEFIGKVVSDKMDKTVVVVVERKFPHPLYKKMVKKTKKFYAHDENNQAKVGDIVRIRESRPLSKLKRWVVVEIINKT